MKFVPLALTLAALVLAGCSTLETPGNAKYFANQPGGLPFLRVSSGLTGPTMSVIKPDGTWMKARTMQPLTPNDPPLNDTPGLAALIENAHKIEGYSFLEFKPGATFQGQPVPSRYFLFPGGFAYPVPPPATR